MPLDRDRRQGGILNLPWATSGEWSTRFASPSDDGGSGTESVSDYFAV